MFKEAKEGKSIVYAEKDFERIEIEVHGLKSVSANIGSMRLSAAAKEMEAAAGRRDEDYIKAHFYQLMENYEKQVIAIQTFLETWEERADGEKELLPAPEPEQLKAKVAEALEQVETFHSKECAAIVEELLNHRLDDRTTECLREVKKQLRLYEDDMAEQLLRELLEKL